MEFGVFTFIIPDTIFNSVKKYMDYELEPDKNSQILFTYDNEPDTIAILVSKVCVSVAVLILPLLLTYCNCCELKSAPIPLIPLLKLR